MLQKTSHKILFISALAVIVSIATFFNSSDHNEYSKIPNSQDIENTPSAPKALKSQAAESSNNSFDLKENKNSITLKSEDKVRASKTNHEKSIKVGLANNLLRDEFLDAIKLEKQLSSKDRRSLVDKINNASAETLVSSIKSIYEQNKINNVKGKYNYSYLFSEILSSLSGKNPELALSLLDEGFLVNYYSSETNILDGWSRKSPHEALEYYLENQGKFSSNRAIFSNFAKLDYNEAFEVLMDNNSRFSSRDNQSNALSIGKQLKGRFELMDYLEKSKGNKEISQGLLEGWAMNNHEDANFFLNEVNDESHKKGLRNGIFENFCDPFGENYKDPTEALEWYYESFDTESLTQITETTQIAEHLLVFNSDVHSSDLQKWLEGSRYSNNPAVVKPIIDNVIEWDVKEAPEFLKFVKDKNDRLIFSRAIYKEMTYKEYSKIASEFIQNSEFSENDLKKSLDL